MGWRWLAAACLCLAVGRGGAQVRFDFETGDLQGWQVMEGRFGALVSDRAMCRNTPNVPYPKQGKYYLSTTELPGGSFDDGMTGTIESPLIRMTGDRITLMVGGGAHPNTRVVLCGEDGTEIAEAHGDNAEQMRRIEWSIPQWRGKRVFLAVEDYATGSWGHVTMDDVSIEGVVDDEATTAHRARFAERKAARVERERRREEARAASRARHAARLKDPKYLIDKGTPRVYTGDSLAAISMPVGGIGTGGIHFDGTGRLAQWHIFGNHNAVALPDTYLAVRCETRGKPAVVRRIEGSRPGQPAMPEAPPPMKTVRFRGEYPFGWWSFTDPELPVAVDLEVFSPTIPGNAADSAIPCAILRVTVRNTGKAPASISVAARMLNAVGVDPNQPLEAHKSPAFGGNVNRLVEARGVTLIAMAKDGAPEAGTMALGALGPGIKADPGSAAPSPTGETLAGALTAAFRLGPEAAATRTFIIGWQFPSAVHGGDIAGWTTRGHVSESRFASAEAVVLNVAKRLPQLMAATRRYHDALYASNLPVWLLDRVASQVAILRSPTVFWGADGYFGGWEGCSPGKGCCAGNCSHVWHYAQAHARLWPEIGRIMREQELRWMKDDGAVPHRQPDAPPAFDGQCGTILGAYREHLLSADTQWLRKHWPRIKMALDYVIRRWDPDEDGVLSGPQWNTLDENLGGSSSWLGSLYIAALMAGEKMAGLMNEPEAAARYGRIGRTAATKQDATLFNGRYYIQIPDATPYRDYGTGCHIDQVLGEWWARMLDLGRVYPEDHVRSALHTLFESNFRFDFVGVNQVPRKFVHDDDAGMQMITWPQGGRPDPEHQMLYADEVMTGFEYSAASAMICSGLLTEGLTVARAIADRYDGRLREGLTASDFASWGFSGNPFGDDECGKYYARAMSSWSLLLACQGLVYDGPAHMIGFRPRWKPDDHCSFFTAAEGWGLFSQKRTRTVQRASLEVSHGRLALKTLLLQLPEGARVSSATATYQGKPLPVTVQIADRDVRVSLPLGRAMVAGDRLEVRLGLK
jgi:uncharacterized protein (DUF608 family)